MLPTDPNNLNLNADADENLALRKCAGLRVSDFKVAAFISLAMLFGEGKLIATEPPVADSFPAVEEFTASPANSQPNQTNGDLDRRATDFGQRMRDRFFKPASPANSTLPKTVDAAPKPLITLTEPPVLRSNNVTELNAQQPNKVAPSQPAAISEQAVAAWVRLSPLRYPVPNSAMAVPKTVPTPKVIPPRTFASKPNPVVPGVEQKNDPEVQAIPLRPESADTVKPAAADVAPEAEKQTDVRTSEHAERIPSAPSAREVFAKFQEMLRRKFSRSQVNLQWTQGSLVVSGTAADRQEAIQIMTFVRETYLVPVIDRLEIASRSASR